MRLIAKPGLRCDVGQEEGIFSGPFLYSAKGRLFFIAFSGSNQRVKLLDLRQCRIVWKSAPFGAGSLSNPAAGRISIGDKRWRLEKDCTPTAR